MQSSDEWVETMAAQIGQGIDSARHGRSDQWISDRTEVLGHPISRTAISEYRRGKRKTMPVTDLLVISAALGAPPVTILFPGLPDAPTSLLPAIGTPVAFDALQWVAGERQTIPEGFDVFFTADSGEEAGHVNSPREYRKSIDYHGGVFDAYTEFEPGPEKVLLNACRQIAEAYDDLHHLDSGPFAIFGNSLPPEEFQRALKDHMKAIERLGNHVKELEGQIQKMGGVVKEETVVTHDEQGERGEG